MSQEQVSVNQEPCRYCDGEGVYAVDAEYETCNDCEGSGYRVVTTCIPPPVNPASTCTNGHGLQIAQDAPRSLSEPSKPEMIKERVLMALPRTGRPEMETMLAAFVNATDDRFRVVMVPRDCSLLAYSFNMSFCEFRNDPTLSRYIMLHSDVYPHGVWLDVLAEEMDKGGFDVIHAPCAIKDGRGLTSTAVGSVREFDPVRRITTHELQELPDTFGYEEYRQRYNTPANWFLLCNTGCLVVKRDRFPFEAFQQQGGFSVLDAIGTNKEGKWEAGVEPEDWRFGRFCAKNGLRVGCCRKVETEHYGRFGYITSRAWGEWKHDAYWEHQNGEGAAISAPPVVDQPTEKGIAAL